MRVMDRTANLRAHGFPAIMAAMAVVATLYYEARVPLNAEQTIRSLFGQSLAFLLGFLTHRGLIGAYHRGEHRRPAAVGAIAAMLAVLAICSWGYRRLMRMDGILVMPACGDAMFACGMHSCYFLRRGRRSKARSSPPSSRGSQNWKRSGTVEIPVAPRGLLANGR